MADRPGFMMYFDFAPALSKLTDEEAGTLFKAIMDYASSGTIHDLPGTCGFAFEVLRPRIDNDRAAYEERCRKNSYSTYIREMKKRNEQPLDYEAWCEKTSSDIARYRTISSDNERYPTELNSTELNSTELNSTELNSTELNSTEILKQQRCNDPVPAVVSDFLNRINPTASPICLQELSEYAKELGFEVCKRAFDIALDSKKTTWAYIKAILQDKQKQGVKCLADWNALEAARAAAKKGKGGVNSGGTAKDSGKAQFGNIV